MIKILTLLLMGITCFSAVAYASGIESLKGSWLGVAPGGVEQLVVFPADLGRYEILLPGFKTRSMISQTDGHDGSQIKVVSELGLMCYYSVFTAKNEMVWKQNDGGSNCPTSISLKRSK